MKICNHCDTLIIYFDGEMDHYQVSLWREECMQAIEMHKSVKVIFDFKDVSFIDSTGIGFILGRYKQLLHQHRELILQNCSKSVYRLFEMSGLFTIMKVVYDE